jgi:hypothetical protein
MPGNHFNVDGNSTVPRRERMPLSGRNLGTVYRQAGEEIALWFRRPMPCERPRAEPTLVLSAMYGCNRCNCRRWGCRAPISLRRAGFMLPL